MRVTALLLVTGCATESWFELDVDDGPTAVGATLFASPQSGSCREGERGDSCDLDRVTTKSVTLTPEGIFERVEGSPIAVELRAIAEGTAVLTVVADNGDETKTFTRSISARAVDRVTVSPSLRQLPCALPARFAIGMRASLPSIFYGGDLVLHGHDFSPIDVAGATLDDARSTDELLVVQLADTPGTVSLSSVFDPGFALTIETFAPAAIESIAIGDAAANWFPLAPNGASIDLIVAGQPACADRLSRTVTVEDPRVCQIYEADGDGTSTSKTVAGMSTVLLRAYRAGNCTITVALDGTALTASKTFTVTM